MMTGISENICSEGSDKEGVSIKTIITGTTGLPISYSLPFVLAVEKREVSYG